MLRRTHCIWTIASFATLAMAACRTPAQQLDRYGGYILLTGSNTSGFFRVEKINGRYWLVTPDNHAMVSLAFTTCLFQDGWGGYCPPLDSYPNPYGNKAKYNNDLNAWIDVLKQRMDRWGFNGLGAWCQQGIPDLTENVRVLFITNRAYNLGVTKIGRNFPDVFDPNFAVAADQQAQQLAAYADDPYRIGAFPDNEIGWVGADYWGAGGAALPDGFIALPASTPGKQYWAGTFLPSKYATIGDLNAAYGTSFTNFTGEGETVINVTELPNDPAHPAIFEDKKDFVEAVADKYYDVVTTAMRTYDSNHLVFGSRWALWTTGYSLSFPEHQAYNERVWKKEGQHCDVVAINCYIDAAWLEANHQLFSRYFAAAKKPFVITEWATWANDTAFARNPGWHPYQKNRGEFYVYQTQNLLSLEADDPSGGGPVTYNMGAQWFQYYDEPSLGRTDGEKAQFGLLNVKDEPYQTALDVMRTFNANVYSYLTDGTPIPLLDPPTPLDPLLPASIQVSASTQLAGWPASNALDGNPDTVWSSIAQGQTGSEWIRLDLGELVDDIGALVATPRRFENPDVSTFPIDFHIQYAVSPPDWADVPGQVYTDYPNPGGHTQSFVFDVPITARHLRIMGTKFGQDELGDYYMQIADLSVQARMADGLPRFEWSAVGGADHYTLLCSPEKCFPVEQTIRVEPIASTEYLLPARIAPGLWYWCARAVDADGNGGKYSDPVAFRVHARSLDRPLEDYLGFEDLSTWRNLSLEDGGWNGTVWAFRDENVKTTGQSSARVIFTMNSLDKDVNQQNPRTEDIVWSWAGHPMLWPNAAQITFDLMPARLVDSEGNMTVASKYVSVRVWDADGNTLLDAAVDPDGSLAPLTWQACQFDLTTPHADEIATVELYVHMAAERVPWDQRMIVWVDNLQITPTPNKLVFQNGRLRLAAPAYMSTQDAHILQERSLYNTGGSEALEAGRFDGADSTHDRSIVIKFTDLDTSPVQGKQLQQATLTLRYFNSRNDPGGVGKTLYVHKLLHDWGEGTQTGIDGEWAGPGEVCWTKPFGATGEGNPNWNGTLSEAYADPNALDSVTLAGSEDYGPVSFDVTEAVQAHLASASENFGFVIREEYGSESAEDGTRQFHSREAATVLKRPSLTLTFADQPPLVSIESVASVVNHGAAGELGLNVNLAAQTLPADSSIVTTESREEGITKLVIDCDANVTLPDPVESLVESIIGASSGDVTASVVSVTAAADEITINLNPLPDEDIYTVTLAGSAIAGDNDFMIRALKGEVDNSGASSQIVNALDLSGVRLSFAADVTVGDNAKYDIVSDGAINALDLSECRVCFAHAAP